MSPPRLTLFEVIRPLLAGVSALGSGGRLLLDSSRDRETLTDAGAAGCFPLPFADFLSFGMNASSPQDAKSTSSPSSSPSPSFSSSSPTSEFSLELMSAPNGLCRASIEPLEALERRVSSADSLPPPRPTLPPVSLGRATLRYSLLREAISGRSAGLRRRCAKMALSCADL